MGESDRGYAKEGKAGGGVEVPIDELCAHVGKKTSDGGYGWVWIGRWGGEVLDFVVGACSQEAGRGMRWSGFIGLSGYFVSMFAFRNPLHPVGIIPL